MYRIRSGVRLFLALAMLLILGTLVSPAPFVRSASATGPTCNVDANGGANYLTIQDAINDVSCLKIVIATGIYYENLIIARDVILEGSSENGTIIDGGTQLFHTIRINPKNRVDISSMLIQHGTGGINNAGSLTIKNSIIKANRNQNTSDGTSGIISTGILTITDSIITDNGSSNDEGGGIANLNIATLNNVTVSNNYTGYGAGGIYAGPGTTTIIRNSTIRDNLTSSFGGGIFIVGDASHDLFAYLRITNSTISGNIGLFGGGITQGGDHAISEITNSTITANSAGNTVGPGFGAGIYLNQGGIAKISNTIVAHNPGNDCIGQVISLGYNLSSDATCGLNSSGDQENVEPLLSALLDNGGSTATHALLPGSPAIDAATNASCPSTDQRGEPRPIDGDNDKGSICDIGAYEYNPFGATALQIANLSPDSIIAGSHGFLLTINGQNFLNGAAVRWNEQNRPTTFINSTQLQAEISAADIAKAGTAIVKVVNPDMITSNDLRFTIRQLKIYLSLIQKA